MCVRFREVLVLVYFDYPPSTFRMVKFKWGCSFLCAYKETNQRKTQLNAVEARHAQPKSKKFALILGSLLLIVCFPVAFHMLSRRFLCATEKRFRIVLA